MVDALIWRCAAHRFCISSHNRTGSRAPCGLGSGGLRSRAAKLVHRAGTRFWSRSEARQSVNPCSPRSGGRPMPTRSPVHRPPGYRSAAEVKRALDRQRPSAARRGYGPRWRRARAGVPGAAPAVCLVPSRRVGWCRRRWSTTWCRIAATRGCSGTRATGLRPASPVTTRRPRARAAGADAASPRGGGH